MVSVTDCCWRWFEKGCLVVNAEMAAHFWSKATRSRWGLTGYNVSLVGCSSVMNSVGVENRTCCEVMRIV